MKVPVVGGVQDGAQLNLPNGAEEGYTTVLAGIGQGSHQTTEYVLRREPDAAPHQRWALVATGLRWPILSGDLA